MAGIDTGKSLGPTVGEAEIYSLMEAKIHSLLKVALKRVGGEG